MKYDLTDKGRAMVDILGPAPAGAIYIPPELLRELEHRGVTRDYLLSTGIYIEAEAAGIEGGGLSSTGPYGMLSAFVDIFYDYNYNRSPRPMDFEWYKQQFNSEFGGHVDKKHMDMLVATGFLEEVPDAAY